MSLSKSCEHSSPMSVKMFYAYCILLALVLLSQKQKCPFLSVYLWSLSQKDMLQQYGIFWHCVVQVHNANSLPSSNSLN